MLKGERGGKGHLPNNIFIENIYFYYKLILGDKI
jgi:hypothetical protein